ncbi:MAG: type II toxin-antitoxin system HicA family toxin [Lyngbya sp. HA4199-MV5]|jgi:predicted RNA binding protein YcfA (HicA-like mRNA interferase family)|nr:type II toxin-antitoxin system HicA family toxin [Lyngbya sp. HA4199-MV5]
MACLRDLLWFYFRLFYGFSELPGKGSHTNWIHALYAGKITVSGKDGADAKRYQEKEVREAIESVKEQEQNDEA